MAERRHIVTLLSDFGNQDYFVAAVKGVMLSINQNIEIVDITHEIPPQDIFTAAFTLRNVYNSFPRFSTHIAVADPGVGSTRRPIIVMTDNYNFIGPDNGIFSYIYQQEEVTRVVHITTEHYFRTPVSSTFHARDIFAPVAGWLSKGVEAIKMGQEIQDHVRFALPQPREVNNEMIKGHILHVDRFGNCITNISANELTEARMGMRKVLVVGNHQITRFYNYYAECPEGEVCALFGSANLWEIVTPKGSAARLLGVNRGIEIALHFAP
jgi:hypothetical protein